MTKFLIFLFLIFVLFSCASNETQVNKNQVKNNIITSQLPDSIKQYQAIMEGIWVLDDYIKILESTKSPFKAAEILNGETSFSIDFDKIIGDSLEIPLNLGNHEGSSFNLYLKKGKLKNSFKTNLFDFAYKSGTLELCYEITKKDTLLCFSSFDIQQKRIQMQKFRRVLKVTNMNLSDGIAYVINKKIFEGKYKDLKTKKEYFFDIQGNTNFLGHNKYQGLEDFIGPDSFDAVYFSIGKKNFKDFGFTFVRDTLFLYNFKTEWDSLNNEADNVGYDTIQYKLLKIN